MSTMNISLPESMRSYVDHLVAEDGYGTASEYLRELIRLDQRRRAQEKLESQLLEGLQTESIELDDREWEAMEREGRRELTAQRAGRLGKPDVFPSITKMCYYYFDTMGFGDPEALYEKCLAEAKKIKPGTKFNPTHIAFHKTNWNKLHKRSGMKS